MQDIKLCAIVVWLNPNDDSEKNISNILTYSNYVDKIFIIDNSKNSNEEMAKKISNANYIPLYENKGIATALNIGCQKALEDGFDWCMTMDQDSSYPPPSIFQQYLDFSKKMIKTEPKLASIAAMPNYSQKSIVHQFREKLSSFLIPQKSVQPEFIFCDRVICSSNIIKLELWKKIGGFDERLFIDEVDHDFCFRLREQGFLIVQNLQIKFTHTIGEAKTYFIQPPDNHNSFRLYYIIRNSLYIIKKYPVYAKKYKYKKNISMIIFRKILSRNFKKNIVAIKNAFSDSKLLT